MKRTLVAIAALLVCCAALAGRKGTDIRLLYWNIQNGMWADQGNNYDNFVSYVRSENPDICVWCESKTHYRTGCDVSYMLTDELYLPAHWNELAARYGHQYVYVGGERDFFPQVITSRFPIENVERITGSPDAVVVSHGAGWARLTIEGRTIEVVTMHTWPQIYNFGIDKDDTEAIAASKKVREGDTYRCKEVEYVCSRTILSDPKADKHLWMMMGDMNSKSRVDNAHYGHKEDHPTIFATQDYIREKTPYIDVVYRWFGPDNYQKTHYNGSRIDYVYCSKALYKMVDDVRVVRTGYPANRKTGLKKGFCIPSDHFPIVVDFKIK